MKSWESADREAAHNAGIAARSLIAVVAGAGITAGYGVRDDLPGLWIWADGAWLIAIIFVLISALLAKSRHLARVAARRKRQPAPQWFEWDLRASWPWDVAAVALVAFAGLLLFIGFIV